MTLFEPNRDFAADYCMMPPDRGNCTEVLYKYYFSPEYTHCPMFVWSGCEGNDNRFDDRHSCMQICTGNYTDEEVRMGVPFMSPTVSSKTATGIINNSKMLSPSQAKTAFSS